MASGHLRACPGSYSKPNILFIATIPRLLHRYYAKASSWLLAQGFFIATRPALLIATRQGFLIPTLNSTPPTRRLREKEPGPQALAFHIATIPRLLHIAYSKASPWLLFQGIFIATSPASLISTRQGFLIAILNSTPPSRRLNKKKPGPQALAFI